MIGQENFQVTGGDFIWSNHRWCSSRWKRILVQRSNVRKNGKRDLGERKERERGGKKCHTISKIIFVFPKKFILLHQTRKLLVDPLSAPTATVFFFYHSRFKQQFFCLFFIGRQETDWGFTLSNKNHHQQKVDAAKPCFSSALSHHTAVFSDQLEHSRISRKSQAAVKASVK